MFQGEAFIRLQETHTRIALEKAMKAMLELAFEYTPRNLIEIKGDLIQVEGNDVMHVECPDFPEEIAPVLDCLAGMLVDKDKWIQKVYHGEGTNGRWYWVVVMESKLKLPIAA